MLQHLRRAFLLSSAKTKSFDWMIFPLKGVRIVSPVGVQIHYGRPTFLNRGVFPWPITTIFCPENPLANLKEFEYPRFIDSNVAHWKSVRISDREFFGLSPQSLSNLVFRRVLPSHLYPI